MTQEQGLVKVETARLVVLDQTSLAKAQEEIAVLETYAQEVLVPDVDYGREKGIAEPFLKDPGASKLFNAFNAYSRPVVLRADINPETGLILFIMVAEVVSRDSGKVLATGVGTCSTLESKYGTRWMDVAEREDFAISPGDAKETREVERQGESVTQYRVPNPDAGNLVQTILSMATKRAEVDAAKSLPGVNTALRLLFMGVKAEDWRSFWRDMRNAGISDIQVHEALGVVSVKDWVAKGRTLGDARKVIFAKLAGPGRVTQPPAPPASKAQGGRFSPGEASTPTPTAKSDPGEAGAVAPPSPKQPRDMATIVTVGDALTAVWADFRVSREEAARRCGLKNPEDLAKMSPAAIYHQVVAVEG